MTDQPLDDDRLDTEGHVRPKGADAESTEGDDTEGHGGRWADAERTEGDDTEGHGYRWVADAESTEGDDDAEGHAYKIGADAESTEGEDTEGHTRRNM